MDIEGQVPAREEVRFTFVADLLERVATRLEPLSMHWTTSDDPS